MILYNLNCIGQGTWVFVKAIEDVNVEAASFSRWAVLVFIILSIIILIVIGILLGFHIYINCCETMTTLEYIKGPKEKNGISYKP